MSDKEKKDGRPSSWVLFALTDSESHIAQTTVDSPEYIYRALCKWMIRGGASEMLDTVWEYMDPEDAEIEEAILDQFLTQAEQVTDDLQTTNIRSKDYSLDVTVKCRFANDYFKTCQIKFSLRTIMHSIGKQWKVFGKKIDITAIRCGTRIEKVVIRTPSKTPAHELLRRRRRVSKRSSKTPNVKNNGK